MHTYVRARAHNLDGPLSIEMLDGKCGEFGFAITLRCLGHPLPPRSMPVVLCPATLAGKLLSRTRIDLFNKPCSVILPATDNRNLALFLSAKVIAYSRRSLASSALASSDSRLFACSIGPKWLSLDLCCWRRPLPWLALLHRGLPLAGPTSVYTSVCHSVE